jgi:hypothetical protein
MKAPEIIEGPEAFKRFDALMSAKNPNRRGPKPKRKAQT